MTTTADFAYMQARLQARHGKRPDAEVWQRLQGNASLGNYLHAARRTTLSPWVTGLQASHGSHAVEQALRQQFREYTDQVARWLPGGWAGAIHPISQLPYLPALQHLLSGEAAPAWMLEDTRLHPIASENTATRNDALLNSDWRHLAQAGQRGTALIDAWLEIWQHQWPGHARLRTGMTHLGRLLHAHIKLLRETHTSSTQQQRETLMHRLQAAFRRYSFEPAAACAHLGLVALDLEKLRGELVGRALFADAAEADA